MEPELSEFTEVTQTLLHNSPTLCTLWSAVKYTGPTVVDLLISRTGYLTRTLCSTQFNLH